jgi:hypothetical protein
MLTVRRADERGYADHGWLHSHHTFSFADYHDPRHMGFGALRVINDDVVEGGGGFPPHHHRDMEILSYVLEGALQHQDSMGNGSIIRRGDVQRMSAGVGVTHSEYNASRVEPVHFLQIWLLPERPRLTPGYEQRNFTDAEKRGRLRLVASPDGEDGSVRLHQDARVYAAVLADGEAVRHVFERGRMGWLHVARGAAELNGARLEAGDGVAIDREREVSISAAGSGEVLLFDLEE